MYRVVFWRSGRFAGAGKVLTVETTAIPDVKAVVPRRFGDYRGFFSEVWSRRAFEAVDLHLDFVQDNHSLSCERGTLRGLHFQSPPFAQDKLIRVTRGRILDVVIDIRRSSPTYGRHVALELSAESWRQLLVPAGFAHGFCTLEPDTEVVYKVTADYAPEHDHGVAFDDPALGISWPYPRESLILSERDLRHPRLADLPAYFP